MTLTPELKLCIETLSPHNKNDWDFEQERDQLIGKLEKVITLEDETLYETVRSALESTPSQSPLHSYCIINKLMDLYPNLSSSEKQFLANNTGRIASKLPHWDTEIFEDTIKHRKLYGESIANQILDCAIRMSDKDFQIFTDEQIKEVFPETFGEKFDKNLNARWDLGNMQFAPYNHQTARIYTSISGGNVHGGGMHRHLRTVKMLDFIYKGPLTELRKLTEKDVEIGDEIPTENMRGLAFKPEIVEGLMKVDIYKRTKGNIPDYGYS